MIWDEAWRYETGERKEEYILCYKNTVPTKQRDDKHHATKTQSAQKHHATSHDTNEKAPTMKPDYREAPVILL